MEPLILASSSPRRAALLQQIGLRFEVIVSNCLESDVPFDDPAAAAVTLALRKANTVARGIRDSGRIVLGADTIVVVDGLTLGKPSDEDDAIAMLKMLTGRTHRVITGIALIETGTLRSATFHEETLVCMRACDDDEIRRYVATGEPLDKAGSYGAQGYGAVLIERVEGCFHNVIGLPLARFVTALRAFRNE